MRGSFIGLMAVHMKAIFSRMKYMGTESINGMMGGSMMGNGIRIKCMGMAFLHGRMEGRIMANIIWIRRKDMAFFSGPMGGSIKGFGKMGSRMVRELILIRKELKELESGLLLFLLLFILG